MAKDYLLSFLSTGTAGEQIANTICVHDDEAGSARDVNSVVDEVDSWLTTKYRGLLPSGVVLDALRCFRIPAVYGADSDVTTKLKGLAGTNPGGDGKLPREVCLTLTLRSTHTSRRSQGRLSLPSPLNSTQLNVDGTWVTGGSFKGAVVVFADALLAGHDVGVGGIGGHLSTRIYSRAQHKDGTGDKTTDVSGYVIRPRPRWLRRRFSIP